MSVDDRPIVDFDHVAARTREESDAQWRELRAECPVAWTEHHGGHWVISRYEENSAAFRDWETFSSARVEPQYTAARIIQTELGLMTPLELDPPLWKEHRRLIQTSLAPPAVEKMRPRVAKWVTHFIDEVIESGHMDMAYGLASMVPGSVVLEWLGFPREDWKRIIHAFHNISGFLPDSPEWDQALADFIWADQRISQEVARRQENPADDAMSWFLSQDIEGEPATVDDVGAVVRNAIGGGVDTTTSLTVQALVHLHFHPEHREALIRDRSLLQPATEEFLRLYAPVRSFARTVTRDTELGGCTLRKGERVLLNPSSASHDEEEFPDAETFVPSRFPNRHMAFGMGIHRCPGSHLARLEFTEMLGQVLDRLPDYRILEEELVPYPNWGIIGGFLRVPVVFTPGERIG